MSKAHSCANCGAATDTEPISICEACDQFDREAAASIRAERDDLATIVRQLIRLVKRTAPVNADTAAANRAQEYLERKGLAGSITR